MELEPQLVALERLGSRMSEREKNPGVCPCGSEALDANGLHLLGAECCGRVRRCVREYFGPGSRYAEWFDDVVQDCYAHLATPGRLERFAAPPEGDRADAFRGWLYTLNENVCFNRLKSLGRQAAMLESMSEPARSASANAGPTSAKQAFAQQYIRGMGERAVANVAARWSSRGEKSKRRFEVLLDPVITRSVDYLPLCEQLDTKYEALKQVVCSLRTELTSAARDLVEDTLALEPGLEREEIERRIDKEIDDLFNEAYPGENAGWFERGPGSDSDDDGEVAR